MSEVLVVTSKVKALVKKSDNMNTSASVIDVLSKHVEGIMAKAIQSAKNDGRKTVMDRDIQAVLSETSQK